MRFLLFFVMLAIGSTTLIPRARMDRQEAVARFVEQEKMNNGAVEFANKAVDQVNWYTGRAGLAHTLGTANGEILANKHHLAAAYASAAYRSGVAGAITSGLRATDIKRGVRPSQIDREENRLYKNGPPFLAKSSQIAKSATTSFNDKQARHRAAGIAVVSHVLADKAKAAGAPDSVVNVHQRLAGKALKKAELYTKGPKLPPKQQKKNRK